MKHQRVIVDAPPEDSILVGCEFERDERRWFGDKPTDGRNIVAWYRPHDWRNCEVYTLTEVHE